MITGKNSLDNMQLHEQQDKRIFENQKIVGKKKEESFISFVSYQASFFFILEIDRI